MLTVVIVERIVFGVILFLIAFNFYLNFNDEDEDTVNIVLKNWASGQYFFITFAWGVLGGHFFLGSRIAIFGSNWWIPVVLVIVIILAMILIGKKIKPVNISVYHQFLLLLAGVFYGHFFWSQRHIPDIDFPWNM